MLYPILHKQTKLEGNHAFPPLGNCNAERILKGSTDAIGASGAALGPTGLLPAAELPSQSTYARYLGPFGSAFDSSLCFSQCSPSEKSNIS